MSQGAVADDHVRVAVREPGHWWRRAAVLVPAGFLLAALVMTAKLWVDPAARIPTNSMHYEPDIFLNIWFMRYAATAVAHGHLPALVTTALNAPYGINVMWNTSMLLPGIVLAPITLLAGPTVSLAVLLTVGFAGSASTMYLVLRRWGASVAAAVLGGAVYGFSPALVIASEDHYHLQFAVLPPLIVDCALRLATGRGRPLRTGAWLGLLMAAQIFIAEEMLVDTAIVVVLALVVLLASRPHAARSQLLADALAGSGVAVLITLLLSGRALWVQFHGPLTERNSPWRMYRFGTHPADLVTATNADLFHGNYVHFLLVTHQQPMETFAYLGWPLLIAVTVATICYWRDIRVRIAGLTFALLEWLGIGNHRIVLFGWRMPADTLPWHLLLRVPVLSQAFPNRLPILADGVAAAVLAFAFDRVRRGAPIRAQWRLPVAAAVTAAVLLPIVPQPVFVSSVLAVPPGWQAAIGGLHLRPGASVLVLPLDPYMNGRADVMELQALSGEPISLVGGYCVAPARNGAGDLCEEPGSASYAQFETLYSTYKFAIDEAGIPEPSRTMTAFAIFGWRPVAILATTGSGSRLDRFLIGLLGPPAIERASVLGWHTLHLERLLTFYAACARQRPFAGWRACDHRASRSRALAQIYAELARSAESSEALS